METYNIPVLKSIEELNKYLISNNINITIIDYIKYVAINIYNINIQFMDTLLGLMVKNEICIEHKYLSDFGVVSNKNTTADINKLVKRNNFIENIDVRLCQVLYLII
jgi:hypothetical protein